MRLQRFEVPGLAHYSYIIESEGEAVVVDPKRDIDTYLQYAFSNNAAITHVLETHIHADFASGARELAERTGAELCLSGHDQDETYEYQFRHTQLRDGSEIHAGHARLTALHTPGHTPEHVSYVIYDTSRGDYPMALLSGDFVFVGSLGRPDLLGEEAKHQLAGELYESLHRRIGNLPNGVEVLPAHGAGSLCGAGLGERQQSTLGYERACNRFFREQNKQAFIQTILGTVPPLPDYYRRMKRVNADGPALLDGIPGERVLAADEFRNLVEGGEHIVVDLRRPEAFGGAHIPGSFNIGAGPTLSTWAAWVAPYDRPILLAGNEGTNYEEARRSLIRVGLDNLRGCLKGGVKSWIEAGYEQAHVAQISVIELHQRLDKGAYVLDVRSHDEWQSGNVPGAVHITGGEVPKRTAEVPRDRTVHVICGSGYRSSVAASVLLRAGFRDVVNIAGGMTAWNKRGLPLATDAGATQAA